MNDKKDVIYQHTINYTLEELQKMVLQPREHAYDENVHTFKGVPIHRITDAELLPGEVFRKYPDNDKIEVSNLGRIKYNGNIMPQSEYKNGELEKGYLYVDVPEENGKVYHLVALTWCQKPNIFNDSKEKWHVHHISDNGYDNRPGNLMWVNEFSHNYSNNPIHLKEQYKWSSEEIKWEFNMEKILQKDRVLENSISHLIKVLELIEDKSQYMFPIFKTLMCNGIRTDDYTILLNKLIPPNDPEIQNCLGVLVSLCNNEDITSESIFGTVYSYRFVIIANYIETTQRIEIQYVKIFKDNRFPDDSTYKNQELHEIRSASKDEAEKMLEAVRIIKKQLNNRELDSK